MQKIEQPLLKIKQDDAQKILNYLAARPYVEVAELVPILIGLELIEKYTDVSKTTTELFDDNLE